MLTLHSFPNFLHSLIGTFDELYLLFKEKHPNEKIGKTTFYELKPKQCICLNNRGIHSVCVCKYHANFKFMFESMQTILKARIDGHTWKNDLLFSVCNEESEDCFTKVCKQCPDISALETLFASLVIEHDDETEISYKQWLNVDRGDISIVTKPISDFITEYCHQLTILKTHHFINSQQQNFLDELKTNLKENECVVLMDFAQNYSHVVQNSIQSQFFNMRQSTLHPVVVYYKSNNTIVHKSYVFISDVNSHDTIFVFCVQQQLIMDVKQFLPDVCHIHYFTDGCASQYKNKKMFLNLMYHFDDFSVEATHHFHATSHGKGPIDGIGGTSKRLAFQAAMKGEMINNAVDLYNFLMRNNTIIISKFIQNQQYECNKVFLSERWKKAVPIKGTLGFHYFSKSSEDPTRLVCKIHSKSTKEKIFKLIHIENNDDDLSDQSFTI